MIQAVHYLTTGTRCYAPGPWDEDLFWLFGPDALSALYSAPDRGDAHAREGGYYTLRSETGFAFVRCGAMRHRPGQADVMHLDLWWCGHNMALDPGTYSYNAPSPWANPLAQTACHNTVTVDDLDQMTRVSRFLWLPWLHGWVTHHQRSRDGQLAYWEGEHDGYRRLRSAVRYRRGILRLGAAHWLVLDALQSVGEHRYRLHWLVPDLPNEWDEKAGHLALQVDSSHFHLNLASSASQSALSLVRADPYSPRGWQAPYYGAREPALSVAVTARDCSLLFWTLLGPDQREVTRDATSLHMTADDWQAHIEARLDSGGSILTTASLDGVGHSQLQVTT